MNWIKNHIAASIVIALVSFTVIAISAWGIIAYSSYQSSVVETKSLPTTPDPSATPTPTPDPLGPYSILLLGYGGPGHDGGSLTDTIILAYIQPRKETVHLISIPRDLWVQLPLLENRETKGYKINAAYAIGKDLRQYPKRPEEFSGAGGGGSLAKHALLQVTGVEPNYFLAVNFYAFEQAIDTLGGISVRVPFGFDDPYYPIAGEEDNTCEKSEEEITALTATLSGDLLNQQFECRYEHLYFDAGTQEMDGETALKYVRSRHSSQAGNDFSRAERQQAVIEAVEKKVIAVNFFPKIVTLLQSLSRNLETDIDSATLSEFILKAPELQNYSIERVVLSEENVLQSSRSSDRQYVLVPKGSSPENPDWEIIRQYIQEQVE